VTTSLLPAVQHGASMPPARVQSVSSLPPAYLSSLFSSFLPSGPGFSIQPPLLSTSSPETAAAAMETTGILYPPSTLSSTSPHDHPLPTPSPPLSPPMEASTLDSPLSTTFATGKKVRRRDATLPDLLSSPAIFFGVLSPVLTSASLELSRQGAEHRVDVALIAIEYLACAIPTVAIILALGARMAARLYCVCLWVAPTLYCIHFAVSPTEQLIDTFPDMQRGSLGGFLIVSAGGGALLGCQPASYLTTREKLLTVAIYMVAKLVSFVVLAIRIGHGREIAENFVMDCAAFVATIYLSLGLHLHNALKPGNKHPYARIAFT
jgi:hypothetical protein